MTPLRCMWFLALLCGMGIVPAIWAQAQAAPAPNQDYRQSFEKWKADLVEDRRRNWLTLVGLFWLKPGENAFGSDQSNAVLLPAGTAPGKAGPFDLEGKKVTIKFHEGVSGKVGGTPVTTGH